MGLATEINKITQRRVQAVNEMMPPIFIAFWHFFYPGLTLGTLGRKIAAPIKPEKKPPRQPNAST